ncbi:hypothetical protein F5Y13DRAFT_178993 [Hypoxylon sp. FL1857]|nr:hypothetical protein F5Y13DRAFT_178993 [Hypoxylon sp. FL1857]
MWIACAKRDLLLGEIDLVVTLRDLQQDGLYALEMSLRLDSDLSSLSDGENDIPPSFFVATVKFSHASVARHYRTQGFYEGIGMDLNSARAHVLHTCVLFLTGNIAKRNGNPWSPISLLEYSADHFLDNLIEVDIEVLKSSQPDKFTEISHGIALLFRDPDALFRWYSAVSDEHRLRSQLFGGIDFCSRIQEWIPECATPRPAARWLRQAKATPQALLRPFAQIILNGWLGLSNIYAFAAVVSLDGYMSMSEFGQPKRTFEWHMRLGITLINIGTTEHLHEARREFRRARSKHGKRWAVYYREAEVLYNLRLYREAIKIASGNWYYLLEIFQKSNLELEDFEAAIKAASEACRFAPRSEFAALNMIYTFHKARRFSDSVDYIKSILETDDDSGPRLLGDVISIDSTASDLIEIACAEPGQLDFARDAFTTVSAAPQAIRAKHALAQLYFRRYNDEEKAMESWESITRDHLRTAAGLRASFALAPLYYTNATEGNGDTESWINKLRKLSEQLRRRSGESESLYAEILQSPYEGDMEQACSMTRPLIKAAVDGLTDRDNANDHNAYNGLAKGLISLGDRENAEIAWAFTSPLQKPDELHGVEMRQKIYPPKGLVTRIEKEYKAQRNGELISVDEWLGIISREWLSE